MTPRQAIFYGEYIKDGNATRAAITAGYEVRSASVTGAKLLKTPKVAAAIAAWRSRQCAKAEITAEVILQEIYKLAMYDPGNLYDEAGNQIPVHRLDDVTRAAVSSVEDVTQETGTKAKRVITRRQRIKLADKGANLERLGKHLKLFGAESEFSASVTGAGVGTDAQITVTLVRPG